jgi:ATP-binding cassette subfamily F protein uup
VIRDFPGSYTDYRQYIAERNKSEESTTKTTTQQNERPRRERNANKMTYREKQEFEALTDEIDKLSAEKEQLEALFNSGAVVDDIVQQSARYEEVKSLLDEKEMRWLELSEKD